jgi:hypothetical protein
MKNGITKEEAKVLAQDLVAEGFTQQEALAFLDESYIMIDEAAEFSGNTTMGGFGWSFVLGGLPGLLGYIVYKKAARAKFVNKVKEKFGEDASKKLSDAITAYQKDKKDAKALAVIKGYQTKLQPVVKAEEAESK